MIRRNGSYETVENENMRGGKGTVKIENLLAKNEFYGKGRLFARITIPVGGSIGYHVHEGEMESFYIVKGNGVISDNGEDKLISPGDTVLTKSNEAHSVVCEGEEPLEMIALIIFE